MPANERYCLQLVQCFDQFSNWGYISEETKGSLVQFLAREAKDDHEAHAAVQDLLADPARASSSATNKVPTIGELQLWLHAQRPQHESQAPITSRRGCGNCENGWIFREAWKSVGGQRMLYSFAGKCPCREGQ
jgi:hypothetical protein